VQFKINLDSIISIPNDPADPDCDGLVKRIKDMTLDEMDRVLARFAREKAEAQDQVEIWRALARDKAAAMAPVEAVNMVFDNYDAATRWCEEHHISIGFLAGGAPCGLKRGRWTIQKWHNLDAEDHDKLDGLMEFSEGLPFTNGPVKMTLRAANA
jgi:hypothetical protein